MNDDFHVYGLYWDEDRLYTYFDDPSNVVLDVDFASQAMWDLGGFGDQNNPWRGEPNAAPFNKDMYLIFNVAVGGVNGYFPDGDCDKPYVDSDGHSVNTFYDAKDYWYPTWNYPETHDSAMVIDKVQVWSFDTPVTEEVSQ